MDALRFAHRFFHFEQKKWEKSLQGQIPDEEFTRRLFREPLFSFRILRTGEPRTWDEAMAIHEEELEREEALGIRAIPYHSPFYPEGIRLHIPPENRPAILYLRGADLPEEKAAVAMVGTRKPSEFGREAAESFGTYLHALGIRVVSGLALGIDTIAHEQNIELGTIAVLGSGVGEVYPAENQILAEKILRRGGTLLSPFPLNQVPLPHNFPARNEIIAALSAGIIVIEGNVKSGASITGKQALAMGKTVVVLAQDFRTDYGLGAIRLHQDGAIFVGREEEAMEAIFRKWGGFAGSAASISRKASFSLADFQKATGGNLPESIALLEEGILQGRIERLGKRYRLR